ILAHLLFLPTFHRDLVSPLRSPETMDLNELTIYLAAAAASDEPIDGREKDLMRHLLRDFGADHEQAQALVAGLPEPFHLQANLSTLSSREVALDLVRALLVISYCDGSFEEEEGRFLTPLIERFSLTGPELTKASKLGGRL